MVERSLAKAFKRKIGIDESFLSKIETKSTESSLLMNPSRRRIFEYICNFPCTHFRELSRATNFSPQNARWHLKKLKERNLITEVSIGRKKVYSPLKNIIGPDGCEILNILNTPDVRRIYLHIRQNPRTTQKAMCNALGLYQQSLSITLLSLENSNLIEYERIGRNKAYSVTEKIDELENAFESKSEVFEKALIEALENDGLNPTFKGKEDNLLIIQLNIPGGEHPLFKAYRNPFKAILGDERKRT